MENVSITDALRGRGPRLAKAKAERAERQAHARSHAAKKCACFKKGGNN